MSWYKLKPQVKASVDSILLSVKIDETEVLISSISHDLNPSPNKSRHRRRALKDRANTDEKA